MTKGVRRHRVRAWWTVGGAIVGLLALGWVSWRIDYERLRSVVIEGDIGFLLLVPLAIAAEQLVRAWKWRQLLHVIRPIGTLRLFGAIMAGYLANILIPLGVSPFVRSWLVARLEALRMSAVLATVAIDRLVDGVVFTGFVAIALIFTAFPDPTGDIRLGLTVGGVGSLTVFVLLLVGLAGFKARATRPDGWTMRLIDRLPARVRGSVGRFAGSFAEGVVWPREAWRGGGIVLASVVIKLIAVTHLLWAGLAFGVVLRPADYVLLIVLLGFLIILTRFARIPGGFFFGAIFALGELFGVADEEALAMVLTVQFSTLICITGIGAFALWREGVAFGDLRAVDGADDERA